MNRIPIAAAACLVTLALPAYAQTAPEKTGINTALGVAPKTQDFLTEAAQSDMLEIQTSKLALSNSDK